MKWLAGAFGYLSCHDHGVNRISQKKWHDHEQSFGCLARVDVVEFAHI